MGKIDKKNEVEEDAIAALSVVISICFFTVLFGIWVGFVGRIAMLVMGL